MNCSWPIYICNMEGVSAHNLILKGHKNKGLGITASVTSQIKWLQCPCTGPSGFWKDSDGTRAEKVPDQLNLTKTRAFDEITTCLWELIVSTVLADFLFSSPLLWDASKSSRLLTEVRQQRSLPLPLRQHTLRVRWSFKRCEGRAEKESHQRLFCNIFPTFCITCTVTVTLHTKDSRYKTASPWGKTSCLYAPPPEDNLSSLS